MTILFGLLNNILIKNELEHSSLLLKITYGTIQIKHLKVLFMIINQTNRTTTTLLCRDSLENNFYSALQILGASIFIAICAQISVQFYFSPVPLSGQTFAVMLIAATMGSRKGVLSVLAYLIEGGMGLPVFAGGSLSFIHFMGPTGGYLLGFLFQAYFIGCCVEKEKVFSGVRTLSVLLFSCMIQLALGAVWLSHFIGIKGAFLFGVAPFILGEFLKATAVVTYLKYNEKNSRL